jgi:hypothetical protein
MFTYFHFDFHSAAQVTLVRSILSSFQCTIHLQRTHNKDNTRYTSLLVLNVNDTFLLGEIYAPFVGKLTNRSSSLLERSLCVIS